MDEIIKKLNEHDKNFEEHGEKLEKLDQQVGNIAKAVVDNNERLDRVEQNMSTKDGTNKIINTLDELVSLHKETEQEQLSWVLG